MGSTPAVRTIDATEGPQAPALTRQALEYLGISANDPATYALAAVAQRFDLDPLLGEVLLLPSSRGRPARVYVTRVGLLRWAHRHPQLAGIEVEHEEGESGWRAEARVHRHDWIVPAVGRAGCGKGERIAQDGHGPEMAEARALRRALVIAFALPTSDEPEGGDLPAAGGSAVAAYDVPDTTPRLVEGEARDADPAGGGGKLVDRFVTDRAVDVATGEVLEHDDDVPPEDTDDELPPAASVDHEEINRQAHELVRALGGDAWNALSERHGLEWAALWPVDVCLEVLGEEPF